MSRTAPPETDDAAGDAVVELRDVSVVFGMERGESRVLDEINIDVGRNEIPGIVGESGCGKTAVALERPTGGAVRDRGQDVWTAHDGTGETKIPYERMRRALQIIHQDPGNALNPNRTVQANLAVPLKRHRPDLNAQNREGMIKRLLERLGVQPAADYAQR
jgi:peptide/nickel transport system ATP-binding protein